MADILHPVGLIWYPNSNGVQSGTGSYTDIDEAVSSHDGLATVLESIYSPAADCHQMICDVLFGAVEDVVSVKVRLVGKCASETIEPQISPSGSAIGSTEEIAFSTSFEVLEKTWTYASPYSNANYLLAFNIASNNTSSPADNVIHVTAVEIEVTYSGEGYETHISRLQRKSIPPKENFFFYHW